MQPPTFRHKWSRWLILPLLLVVVALLAVDRYQLFQAFFTQYIDEDQAIEWYAAHETLRGQIHEPCFYGQSYNSNLEGMLAAPLVALHMPYRVAVPLVTVTLGLLPFLLLAWCAWRRRQFIAATLALVTPALLSTRYDIITGMPRGFVTGVAIGILPALLFLPPIPRKPAPAVPTPEGTEPPPPPPARPRLRRTWRKSRYFLASFLTIVAVMLNPNAAVLLVPVVLFGFLTSFLDWRFWLFGALGAAAALPYPWIVKKWYFDWHPDYRLYLADRTFTWSQDNFWKFLPTLDEAFHDLLPQPLYDLAAAWLKPWHNAPAHTFAAWAGHSPAPVALLAIFALTLLVLLLRLRLAATLALLAGVALVLVSFCYSRVHDGRPAASFPYSRMFLAVPVLWIWLLLLINPPRLPRPPKTITSVGKWASLRRGVARCRRITGNYLAPALSTLIILALIACAWIANNQKLAAMAADVKTAVDTGTTARAVPLADGDRLAAAIQSAANEHHVDFVLMLSGEARKWVYALPEMTTCETLYPVYERRTWRLVEECTPRHDKILVSGMRRRPARGSPFPPPILISQDPPLALYDLKGRSVIDFCDAMQIHLRAFDRPPAPVKPPATSQPASPTQPSK